MTDGIGGKVESFVVNKGMDGFAVLDASGNSSEREGEREPGRKR